MFAIDRVVCQNGQNYNYFACTWFMIFLISMFLSCWWSGLSRAQLANTILRIYEIIQTAERLNISKVLAKFAIFTQSALNKSLLFHRIKVFIIIAFSNSANLH